MFLVIGMSKYYLCIDLKTFYASVECVERGLDPFQVDLVVADKTRSKNTICLAISPKMKKRGIKNRCRMSEIPKNVRPIIAKPRMKKYIEYSAKIYKVYLKYIDKNDIHVYSIDEVFLDVTSYLNLYHKNPIEMAKMIIKDIYQETGITATAGVGTNLYLAKIALDLIAKHIPSGVFYLDEKRYQKYLGSYTPLHDFWQIGRKIEARLHRLHLKTMNDISLCNPKLLYKEFGVDAELLIDHAKGIESCTIKDIKNYKRKSHSLSSSQILLRDYQYQEARNVLIEMIDSLTLQLVSKNLYTNLVGFSIGYSNDRIESLKVSKKLEKETNNYSIILKILLEEYDFLIAPDVMIRRISVGYFHVFERKYEQLDFFMERKESDTKLLNTINKVKLKYGNNSILRGVSYLSCSTQRSRNQLIGGHNAE